MAEQKAVCGGFIVGEGLEMNGKVLSATGGAGDGDFVITMWKHGDVYELDKTYEEIEEAFNEHKTVKLLYESGLYIGSRPTNNDQTFVFSSVYIENFNGKTIGAVYSITVQYDGSVEVEIANLYITRIVEMRYYSSQNKYIFLSPWSHSRVYEYYSKGNILAFESSDGEVFTLEHCDADKTILSNKHLNDDGTVSLRILTATGTTTSSTTMVTKTIS